MRTKVAPVTGGAGGIGTASRGAWRARAAGFTNGENVICDGAQPVGVAPWRAGAVNPI